MAETFSTGRDLGEEQSSSVSKEGQLESDSDLNFGGLKQGLAEDPSGVTSACPPPHMDPSRAAISAWGLGLGQAWCPLVVVHARK